MTDKQDFYEPDESTDDVVEAWETGEKGVTRKPVVVGNTFTGSDEHAIRIGEET